MDTTTSPQQPARLIRMKPLTTATLPSHASLPSADSNPSLPTFLTAALSEAEDFARNYVFANFTLKSDSKTSPPATAPVSLYSHDRKTPNEADEAWFARTSAHDNAAKQGTASWDEFDSGLRVDHSAHEREYTPGVIDAHEVLDYSAELERLPEPRRVGVWTELDVRVMEMVHKIPSPMNDRVFPVLVITAKKDDGLEFLVVQIPVATNGLSGAKYHNAPKVVGGMYCSIEHGEVIDSGERIRWTMATASDAGGSLPMWMQKMGVPAAVVKDVGFFIGWCAERRKGGQK